MLDPAEVPPNINNELLVYLPQGQMPTRGWPLIVFLHGSGDRGLDISLVNRYSLPKYLAEGASIRAIVISPQSLPDSSWRSNGVLSVVDWTEAAFSVDRRRIYLVGFSMGAFGVWETIGAAPKRFAAAIPLAGGGSSMHVPARGDARILAIHGDRDDVVPINSSRETVAAFQAKGWKAKFRILKNRDHGIGEIVAPGSDALEWLLDQHLP